MIKIIYIAGDGRSGSTLLDAILSNIEGSISVGECNRYWVRYPENESHCACASLMQDCSLWSKVEARLKAQFPDYDAVSFEKKVKELQYYKNFKNIPSLIQKGGWLHFTAVVKAFYTAIAEISESSCIIDSSKSMPWGYLLQHLDGFDVRVIHLERNLLAVGNSWKKTIRLPEYTDREVFMPKKGNRLIAKTWLKTKLMGRTLKKQQNYTFVRYESLCNDPAKALEKIQLLIEESIPMKNLQLYPNHAIGGNPMRSSMTKLEIKRVTINTQHLGFLDTIYFKLINGLAKLFLS